VRACSSQLGKQLVSKIQTGNPEGKKLVAFTSAHSHYTIKRSTWMMGMGLDAAINVSVDADGKMSPQALGSHSLSF
jgi:glutamate/tyrosine decarboxylase-like PLP-dependent enzyme